MSLPDFSLQGSLFSTAALGQSLFPPLERYRLFAQLVFPQLVRARTELAKAYSANTGRLAVEPVLLLGVSILQYLDGVPDRGAVELLRYHAGWNFALNRQLGDELFHPTTLSKFRDRLLEHQLIAVAFSAILDGLVAAGLVARNSRQRLDSTQIFGLVSKMSRVEGARETLRLALEELAPQLPESSRPPEWVLWWERYVESKLDYKATTDKLAHKLNEAGGDAARVLQWLETQPPVAKGAQVKLLAQFYGEQFTVTGLSATGALLG